MTIQSFIPPKRILMGPGPSDISPQVLQALSRPTVGHLDPLFVNMMDELKQLLKYAFQTDNEFDSRSQRQEAQAWKHVSLI